MLTAIIENIIIITTYLIGQMYTMLLYGITKIIEIGFDFLYKKINHINKQLFTMF